MARQKKFDPDIPPTSPGDWTGAAVVYPGERRAAPVPGGMTFHIFRASTNSGLFVITDRDDASVLPNCPRGGQWRAFKILPETGQRRVGFTEAEAKADILKRGFHLVEVDIGMPMIRRRPSSPVGVSRRRTARR